MSYALVAIFERTSKRHSINCIAEELLLTQLKFAGQWVEGHEHLSAKSDIKSKEISLEPLKSE